MRGENSSVAEFILRTRLAKYVYLEKQVLIPYFNRNPVLILSLNQRGLDGRKRDIRKHTSFLVKIAPTIFIEGEELVGTIFDCLKKLIPL